MKNFILLLSLSKESAKTGQLLIARIKRDIDANATPAWIDSRGVGIFISTRLRGREVWAAALPVTLTDTDREALRDMVLLEIGKDCLAAKDAKVSAWLNSHRLTE